MSIALTAVKFTLSQIGKLVVTPGTAGSALLSAAVVGEIISANNVGENSEIYIPIYGSTGIDSGIVGYTSVAVGFVAGLGALAAGVAGVSVAAGVGALALGMGIIAVAVNPNVQISVKDIATNIVGFLDGRFSTDKFSLSGDYDQLGNFISNLQTQFQTAKTTVSPLVLDLDGDGIETLSKSLGIHFDHDGNQFAETTGWVGKDDGLLVWDRNGNGCIDDGSELFGNNTLLNNGSKAANGFAALAELDSNYDNKIDASDNAFSQLRLWKDADSDALLSEWELLSLDTAGVKNFNLAYQSQTLNDAQGNQHLQVGSYTRTDGSSGAMDDVWFAADTARTIDQDIITIDDAIAALPDVQGFGNVHSLHQAMARDQSGKLKELVQEFSLENDIAGRHALLQDILFMWTGSSGYEANSRGGYFSDARKLYTLEAFLGERFIQGFGTNAGTNDPGPEATKALMSAFKNLSQMLYEQLMTQTHHKNLYDSIGLKWDASGAIFEIDVGETVVILESAFEIDSINTISLISDFGKSLKSGGAFGEDVLEAIRQEGSIRKSEFSYLLTSIESNFISGNDSNEIISGDYKNENLIFGFGGDDTIYASDADDVLSGGIGNDLLFGERGNDTYLFAMDYGSDSIRDYDNTGDSSDMVHFIDIAATDLTALQRSGNDLLFKFGRTDQLTVKNYFENSFCRIEQFTFADGVSWDDAAIKSRVITIGANVSEGIIGYEDGSNRIYGMAGNDKLFGGSLDDVIDGGGGDDLLDAGTGNDILDGGDGSDIYILHGAGVDRISDSGGWDVVQFTDVVGTDITSVERHVNDLVLKYGMSDQFTVSNYFKGVYNRIDKFVFADGVSWDDAAIKSKSMMTTGTADNDAITGYYEASNHMAGFDGNDYLIGERNDDWIDGGNGNDTLIGGAGNDWLDAGTGNNVMDGGSGNDAYILHAAGVDQISDENGSDLAQFIDVDSTDIAAVERYDNNLLLKYAESGQLVVKNYFDDGAYSHIEQFTFADGIRWDDVMFGAEGNESVVGDGGNNVLLGTAKNERMAGGIGNDTYFFSKGDGIDRINDFDEKIDNHDTVRFLDVSSNEIINLQRLSNDLVFHYGSSDQLIVSNYFEDKNNQIEKFNFSDGVSWDEAVINSRVVTAGRASVLYQWGYHEDMNLLSGSEGGDVLVGSLLDDLMEGGDGNDNMSGNAGHDLLVGGRGDDILSGGNDSDVLDGGIGNDMLDGGSGSDMYLFASGDGSDSISDFDTTTGNHDRVLFADMASTEINSLQKLNNDLVISFGKSDRLAVKNYFTDPNYQIEEFSFSDGISWDDAAIKARLMMSGTAASEAIRGLTMSTNRIAGLDGNDALYGGELNDVLDGGKDNDYLSGSSGNDTYLFAKGDGIDSISESGSRTSNSDTIKFTDISASEVTALQRSGNNLVIQYGSSDQITVNSYFYDEAYEVEQFVFSDGEVWDEAAFKARIMTSGTSNNDVIFGYADATNHIAGKDGNDLLSGGNGNDVIEGGNGNDFIFGGAGNDEILTGEGFDVIAFNRGHGHDTVVDSSGQDNTLSLGKGISSADLTLSKFGNDLILSTGIDGRVTLKDWYESTIKHSIKTLQIVTPTETGYGFQTSAPVQQFDFSNIVNAYDQKRAENEIADAWALVAAMKDNQLGGSSWNAIGGYVANEFASDKNSADMSLYSLQNSLSSSQFGQSKELVVSFSSPRAWY